MLLLGAGLVLFGTATRQWVAPAETVEVKFVEKVLRPEPLSAPAEAHTSLDRSVRSNGEPGTGDPAGLEVGMDAARQEWPVPSHCLPEQPLRARSARTATPRTRRRH